MTVNMNKVERQFEEEEEKRAMRTQRKNLMVGATFTRTIFVSFIFIKYIFGNAF